MMNAGWRMNSRPKISLFLLFIPHGVFFSVAFLFRRFSLAL